MTDDLQSYFEAGEPLPATDPGFRLEVMSRVARRRFWLTLAARAGAALLLALVLSALWPAIDAVIRRLGDISAELTAPVSTIALTLVALAVLTYAARWASTIRIRR